MDMGAGRLAGDPAAGAIGQSNTAVERAGQLKRYVGATEYLTGKIPCEAGGADGTIRFDHIDTGLAKGGGALSGGARIGIDLDNENTRRPRF